MELPKISDEQNLTLSQAKQEYIELTSFLKDNRPEFGWLDSILTQFDLRLNFLRKLVTDKVCKIDSERIKK